MANQMIALQARNPQLPDPARVTAQMGQMLNTVAQQRAAERQAERLAQEMDFARAAEERAVQTQTATMRQKDLDYLKDLTAQYRDRLATINPADKARYGVLRQEIIDTIPAFANELPLPDEWNQNSKVLTIAKADDVIKYSLATPVASLELSQSGMPRSVTVGGLNPEQRPVYDAPETSVAPRTPTAAAPQTNPMAAGATPNTAAAEPGSLGLVVSSALETGVMSKSDYDKIISIAPPESRAKIAAWVQQNNIQVTPNTPGVTDNQMRGAPADFEVSPMSYDGQTPESQFAVYRGEPMQSQTAGLRGAPPMEQTLAQTRTSTPLQMRNPNQPIAPGSSVVPLGRLGAEKQVEAQAAKDVELRMAPAIAKATKQAERAVELKSTATKAKYATEGILNEIADRINTIDQLLRNPKRFSIVGPIEGNLPRLLQTGARADAQAAFDKIKNTATLTSLIDMRKNTETGASPVGANPTDKDAKIVEQAASKLIQTGEPATFDAELMDMRRKLYRTYQSAQREYDGVYGEVLKENPKLRLVAPKVSDRYISSKDLPQRRTSTKVDRNNPLLRGM
jgi:hypothetical protein